MQYTKIREIPPNGEIIADAKTHLKGNWLAAIGASSGMMIAYWLVMIFVGVAGAVPLVLLAEEGEMSASTRGLAIAYSVISGCLSTLWGIYGLGIIRWFLDLQDGKTPSIGRAFLTGLYGYGRFSLAGLLVALIVFLKALLLIVPGILALLDYCMTIPCLIDDPSLGIRESLKRSRAIMYGHRWQMVRLSLRFLGLGILCIFTLGIGLIWLWPYCNSCGMAFFRAVMPEAGSEDFAKLPPVKGYSALPGWVGWAILALALLLSVADFWDSVQRDWLKAVSSEEMQSAETDPAVQTTPQAGEKGQLQ